MRTDEVVFLTYSNFVPWANHNVHSKDQIDAAAEGPTIFN